MQAISDVSRLRIIMGLSGGERCVCKLTALLGLAPSTVSKHLSILRRAGLVESRRDGTWMYYRLVKTEPEIQKLLKYLSSVLAGDKQIIEDQKTLTRIEKNRQENLCPSKKKS